MASSGSGNGRTALIIYQYQVGGQIYESSAISVGWYVGGVSEQQLRTQFPVGKQVPVYYNPRNPAVSALLPGNKRLILLLVLMIFMFAVLFVIFGGWRWFGFNIY